MEQKFVFIKNHSTNRFGTHRQKLTGWLLFRIGSVCALVNTIVLTIYFSTTIKANFHYYEKTTSQVSGVKPLALPAKCAQHDETVGRIYKLVIRLLLKKSKLVLFQIMKKVFAFANYSILLKKQGCKAIKPFNYYLSGESHHSVSKP